MKKLLSALFLIFSFAFVNAQSLTWSSDIAPILYKNCTNCHHEGGLAPFSLLDYQSAHDNRFSISSSVTNKMMPPWPPDAHYRRYANERLLSTSDIEKINAWVNADAPIGDTTLAPARPVYTNSSALGTPDWSQRIVPFTVPVSQATDLYKCFVIPTNLSQNEFVTAVEVIPGNSSIVHHVLVFQDTTGEAKIKDDATPEPGYTSFGGIGTSRSPILVAGWVPGSQPAYLPANMGIKLYAHSDLVVQIHYPAGSGGKMDSTRLNLKLSTGALRTVSLAPILNHVTSIIGGPLNIPANTTKTYEEYFQIPDILDLSVLSVAPHAHLIAKEWLCYAVTPTDDTIPLIKIDNWDFHWQGSYGFRNLMKIPKATKLYAFCKYDNTSNNHHNPSNPPQTVTQGEATTDEMMLVYFAYTFYQPGDENIVMDTTALVDITDTSQVTGLDEMQLSDVVSTPQLYEAVPNPANTETTIGYFLPYNANASIKIFDLSGRLVDEIKAPGNPGFNSVKFNTGKLSSGEYIYSLTTNGNIKSKHLMISR